MATLCRGARLCRQAIRTGRRNKRGRNVEISEAIEQCRKSGRTGVALVEVAQALVSSTMMYSYSNSFDLPSRAFRRGRGYCWHQASTLNRILNGLGLESRLVYATRNRIPEKRVGDHTVQEHVSGHVWCRVRCDGLEGDVCPGNATNRFGQVHFEPLSRVRNWNGFVCFFSYWGSAWVNWRRRRRMEYDREERQS